MFEHLERFLHPERVPTTTKEVMTFREWFLGRFWAEWVVGRKNKPTEVRTKTGVYEGHSKALKYAVDCELIAKSPKIGLFKIERPEIVAWDFAQYARLLAAAKTEGEFWYTGVCLAGEAGLRVGEVKALRWREDVDMVAATITVNQQTRNGDTTTPKGRTRRTVPMTSTLHEALKRMETIREGFVVSGNEKAAKTAA